MPCLYRRRDQLDVVDFVRANVGSESNGGVDGANGGNGRSKGGVIFS